MTEAQRKLARHALGLDGRRKVSYRNRFYATRGSADHAEWALLAAFGMAEYRSDPLNSKMDFFWLTRKGAEWQYDPMQPMTTGEMGAASPYRGGYACLWDEINDERATWKSNPWIWAYSFKRLA